MCSSITGYQVRETIYTDNHGVLQHQGIRQGMQKCYRMEFFCDRVPVPISGKGDYQHDSKGVLLQQCNNQARETKSETKSPYMIV